MSNYNQFYTDLLKATVNLNPTTVKTSIGDSTNNNRTLTVGQVARYLRNVSRKTRLATSITRIHSLFREDIQRARNNSRTDAIDINEFIAFYESEVVLLGNNRNLVNHAVA